MTQRTNPTSRALKPLAACIGAFCLPAISAIGATHTVSNCNDSSSGSLRAVVNASTTHSGDTVDMTTLMCSTISLKTGITIAQNNLKLNGPGENRLNITAYGATKHRMLRHTGIGTLKINNMSITNGYAGTNAGAPASSGGCIVSIGSVSLDHVLVASCKASGTSMASGGGIYASYSVSMLYSTLRGNTASTSAASGTALGGGADTLNFTAADSSVEDNSALGTSYAVGGGLYVAENLTLTDSTISGNLSDGTGGGIRIGRVSHIVVQVPAVKINNSTISGNEAAFAGGIYSEYAVTLRNSTIAFNTAGLGNFSGPTHTYFIAAGLAANGPRVQFVELQSSLIANNTYGASDEDSDFSVLTLAGPAITVSGASNLIRNAHAPTPGDTLTSCPLLGPLRDNGGETKTHALLSHSPGIDAGNNTLGFINDQRGPPFVRVSGVANDIGAYEVQADIIFNNGFDGCPLLPI